MSYRRSGLRGNLKTGILHFGLGAFHRAHQAPFTEDAIDASGGDWGIEAVAMRSPELVDALAGQDNRYTLIEQHPDGQQAREISVIRAAHVLPRSPWAVIGRMADPAIQVVTITVTEKGYGVRPGTGELDESHPAIANDLSATGHPEGLLGVLCAGLQARQAAGLAGLSVLSCDNLPSNGQTLRNALLQFSQRKNGDVTRWIADSCTFPDSMVDRITPAATKKTMALAGELSGHADIAAVETEPFLQWVIEDRFAGPRPDWAATGVQIVPDVAPYELMKLRMLNGAHSMIAYLGTCAGLTSVRDVMAIPELMRLVRVHMHAAAETLPEVPGLEPGAYADALVTRFENPAIDHRCLQIAMDGSQKMPQRLFFAAAERLQREVGVETFAFATACWLHHVERSGADALNDPMAADLLRAIAGADARASVVAVGSLPGIAETRLFEHPDWIEGVASALTMVRDHGALATARRSLTGASR